MKAIPFHLFSFHCPADIHERILASGEKFKTIRDSCNAVLIEAGAGAQDHIQELVKNNADRCLVVHAGIENFEDHVSRYRCRVVETGTDKVRLWFLSDAEILPRTMLLYLLYAGLDPGSLRIKPNRGDHELP